MVEAFHKFGTLIMLCSPAKRIKCGVATLSVSLSLSPKADGRTPLLAAATFGDLQIVRALLMAGACQDRWLSRYEDCLLLEN